MFAAVGIALTALLAAGGVVITITKQGAAQEASAPQGSHAAPSVTVQQPRVEILSKVEVEQIATRKADEAALRVTAEFERRRTSERELLDQRFGRVDDKLDNMDEKLGLIVDRLRRPR